MANGKRIFSLSVAFGLALVLAWGTLARADRLARYCQLPQSRMSEAVTYLTQLDVAENGRALPASAPVSTEFSFRSEFPADMDAGRRDGMEVCSRQYRSTSDSPRRCMT